MSKAKRLYVLLGVLAAVCIATFAVKHIETKKEDIRVSGETVFALDAESVTGISWTRGEDSLSFYKDDDGAWKYAADEAFSVDADKINERLGLFEAFNAAFTIENADDLGAYGLDKPECTVTLTTADGDIRVTLGDYSNMDAQRYVSFGGDTVYLAAEDPLESFGTELKAMIKNDTTPDITEADTLTFSGGESYTIVRDENGESICEDDIYFADGKPLDTSKVKSYLRVIASLGLGEYASYDVNLDKLGFYGLDNPAFTVTLGYTDDDGEEKTFSLAVGQNKSEVEIAEKNGEDVSTVQAYCRVGESKIVYELNSVDYAALLNAGFDDLRHDELFTGDFDALASVTFTLDGENYRFDYSAEEEEKTLFSDAEKRWRYNGEVIDDDAIADIESALCALSAASFTEEYPTGKSEIAVTLCFGNENADTLTLELYRRDGSFCLAEVDGKPTALCTRESMTKLCEAVYAVTLGGNTAETEN